MPRTPVPHVPLATYRLQFGPGFTFRDAEALVPYLNKLGISHVYASPILKARKGSTHGYDIIDHNRINEELGDERDFDAFAATLRENGMGLILDFVPNHMGVGRADNAWWLDVLEWGPASPYATFFDIDWQPAKRELRGKLLLPFLGDHYGRVLEEGELALRFDAATGTFSVWYHDHRFPVAPRDYGRILANHAGGGRDGPNSTNGGIGQLIQAFLRLRLPRLTAKLVTEARDRTEKLKKQLSALARADVAIQEHIHARVVSFNGTPGDRGSFVALHRLLQRQHYRLSFWKVAASEINYRRFFDINELAGIRVERPEVFDTVHRTVLRWIGEGKVQGLRIDHIDGVFDPEGYCARLRDAVAFTRQSEPDAIPFYISIEKILAQHENLRPDWAVTGTTGYEFANVLNGLFVDPSGEHPLRRFYRAFSGNTATFDQVLYHAKLHVLDHLLGAELSVLATDLDRLSETQWQSRDFTLDGLGEALKQIVACFPVYRTYVTARGLTLDDRRDIDWAVSWARRRSIETDPSLFDFIHAVLTTDLVRRPGSGYSRSQVVRFAMKFQQLTGPAMAKSLEDTSFYRYVPLVSLNEVGGDPRRFGVSAAAFHHLNQDRWRRHRHTMLATTTHDTKRSEDVRARINVLSEIPAEWEQRVRRWSRLNRSARGEIGGQPAPTRNDEYLLYQTLIGAWPHEPREGGRTTTDDAAGFAQRIEEYMVKAVREAKEMSSWANPNTDYEGATRNFVRRILDQSQQNPFLDDLLPFQQRVARIGALNSLSQAVLKLSVPGIPDLYQGCETWNLRLVDPDNRAPVDFEWLRETLVGLSSEWEDDPLGLPPQRSPVPMDDLDDRMKQFVTWRLLSLRRAFPELFLEGDYRPLEVIGSKAENLCAFEREYCGRVLIVVVPRLIGHLNQQSRNDGLDTSVWRGTKLMGSIAQGDRRLTNLLTGEDVVSERQRAGNAFDIEKLFSRLPIAVVSSPPITDRRVSNDPSNRHQCVMEQRAGSERHSHR